MRRTKIVCTIGPATSSYKLIKKLIEAGMDVARLNFSHGSYEEHSLTYEYIRQASLEIGKPVAILQDLGGPKIRTGLIQREPAVLKEGSMFTLTTRNIPGNEREVSITYPLLPQKVRKGETLFEIYAEKRHRLNRALRSMEFPAFTVGKKSDMVLAEIPEEEKYKKYFILER